MRLLREWPPTTSSVRGRRSRAVVGGRRQACGRGPPLGRRPQLVLRYDSWVERVAVVGCIGAGKSTVARALGRKLDIEVFHLDRYWWKPGRYRVTGRATVAANTVEPDEFRRLEERIVAGDRWIVDGDAANQGLRLSRADTVVFLDFPRWLCLWGLLQRHLKGSYDYPDGVRGSWRWVVFLARWVWRTWPSQRRPRLVVAISDHATNARIFHLRNRREVRSFLSADGTR